MKAYWKASLISEVITPGISGVPRGPEWDKISLRAKHHARSSPHPPSTSHQNQRHDTDKAPVEAFTATHHGKQLEDLSHGEEREQTANMLLHLCILRQPDQANVFQFSGIHCRALVQSILHTYTCKRWNFGRKCIPNLSFLLKQVLTGPNYNFSTVGKTEPQSKNFTSSEEQ